MTAKSNSEARTFYYWINTHMDLPDHAQVLVGCSRMISFGVLSAAFISMANSPREGNCFTCTYFSAVSSTPTCVKVCEDPPVLNDSLMPADWHRFLMEIGQRRLVSCGLWEEV